MHPIDQTVAPEDIHATMYHALGIPPDTVVYDQFNAPHRICDGRPLTTLF